MRQALKLHPDSPCRAATDIEVYVERPRLGALRLRFAVRGAVDGLRLPPPTAPARADGLWQHTCFEAFVRTAPDGGYYELNFAPSGQWAAYRFERYRGGRSNIDIAAPMIQPRSSDGRYELCAEIDGLPHLPWKLGISAVIEEADGRKSYWALAHPPGKADFHHPDSFALELPAATP